MSRLFKPPQSLVLGHAGAQPFVVGARLDCTQPTPGHGGMLLIGSFAIFNAMLGTWLAWRLLRDEPAAVSTLKIE